MASWRKPWAAWPLLWRVFAGNAALLVAATLVLVISPATISFPVALTEAIVVGVGLALMLLVNLAILTRTFSPLRRLTAVARDVDPLAPGRRFDVDDADTDVSQLADAFNEMLDRLETERRETARRALAAQEAERARLSRDLHDEVGQALTGVVLSLERVSREVPESSRPRLHDAKSAVRTSLEEVRAIARSLRPEALDDLGLGASLLSLATAVEHQTGIEVRRSVAHVDGVGADAELVIFRVAQESLTNVARHSGARSAELRLDRDERGLTLTVSDDGRGIDERAVLESGGGLRGMRERALLVGARLTVAPRDGGGTEVRLEVPAP